MASPTSKDVGPSVNDSQRGVRSSLPIQRRAEKVVDAASEISSDEWGEIQRYGDLVEQEKRRKERNDYLNKQKQVKEVLDQQVKHVHEEREKLKEKQKQMDKMILEKAKAELDQEAAKKQAI